MGNNYPNKVSVYSCIWMVVLLLLYIVLNSSVITAWCYNSDPLSSDSLMFFFFFLVFVIFISRSFRFCPRLTHKNSHKWAKKNKLMQLLLVNITKRRGKYDCAKWNYIDTPLVVTTFVNVGQILDLCHYHYPPSKGQSIIWTLALWL